MWRSGVVVVGLGLCAVAAGGQGPRERPRPVLRALDADGDGALSKAEVQAASTALLGLDRDGNHELTADEIEPPREGTGATPEQLVSQMMSLDKNSDGALTPDEVPERMRALFTRADANSDGRLTPEEIRHAAAHTGAPNGRATAAGKAGGIMRLDPVLNALDADHDGVISGSEIAAAPTALQALDADHDGVVSVAELRVRQMTPAERAAHVLEEFDSNRDGKLSQEEAPDGLRPRFAGADVNHDGMLDGGELQTMFATMTTGQAGGGRESVGAPAATEPKGEQR